MEISDIQEKLRIFDLQKSLSTMSQRQRVDILKSGKITKKRKMGEEGGVQWEKVGMASQPEKQDDVFVQCIKCFKRIVFGISREIWSTRNTNSIQFLRGGDPSWKLDGSWRNKMECPVLLRITCRKPPGMIRFQELRIFGINRQHSFQFVRETAFRF